MKNDFESYVNSFLEYLQYELHYSEKTILTYQRSLHVYSLFLKDKKYSFLNINRDKANQYKAYLITQNYDNKSSSLYLSAVRCFYRYLVEIIAIEFNPFANMKNPKIAKKLPNFLNQNDIEEMFLKLDYTNDLELRNVLMVEFLYVTGLRVSELVHIKLKDMNEKEGTIKVLGKGNKERIIFYKACDKELLKEYLTVTRNSILKGISSEYLFISASGKPLTTRTVENVVKKYAQAKKIKSKVTPHTMRHTYATDLLNHGADLRSVGELLGHESLSTTQIYTHVTSERLKSVYKRTHPREKMQK